MNEFEMERQDDSVQIQLLVDGQLGHDQRSQWLRSISDDSDIWRELALQFVEQQVLNETLRSPNWLSSKHASQYPANEQHHSDRWFDNLRGGWSLAMVASLFVGVVLGGFWFSSADQSEVARRRESVSMTEMNESSTVKVASEGKTGELSLALADALSRSTTPVSMNARRAFLKAGYFVDEDEQIANVKLPTGNSIQMPIRCVTVRYLGQNAYQ